MRTFYRENMYFLNEFLHVDIFPIFTKSISRKKRLKPTSEIQEKLNKHNAAKKLQRTILLNFTENDIYLTLTYTNKQIPSSEEEARKNIKNFIRRLKYINKDLKYIYVTERGSRSGRFHHHLILNNIADRETVEKMWKNGTANSKRLQFGDNFFEDLAAYIVKSPINKNGYVCSRNIIKPVAKERNGHISRKSAQILCEDMQSEIIKKIYPGYELLSIKPIFNEIEPGKNPVNHGYYLTIQLRRAV